VYAILSFPTAELEFTAFNTLLTSDLLTVIKPSKRLHFEITKLFGIYGSILSVTRKRVDPSLLYLSIQLSALSKSGTAIVWAFVYFLLIVQIDKCVAYSNFCFQYYCLALCTALSEFDLVLSKICTDSNILSLIILFLAR
jgi:hypothetical protein